MLHVLRGTLRSEGWLGVWRGEGGLTVKGELKLR